MSWLPFIPFLFVPVVLAFAFWVARRQKALRERFFERLRELGAAPEGRGAVFERSGRRVYAFYQDGDRNSRFQLRTPVSSSASFSAVPRKSSESFFAATGLENPVQTGDPEFDSAASVESEERDFVSSYFAAADKRQAVLALLRAGAGEVELDRESLSATWQPFPISESTDTAFVPDALAALERLAAPLPATAAVLSPSLGSGARPDVPFSISMAVVGILVALGPLIYAVAGRPLDGLEVFKDSLRFSLPAALLAWMAAVTRLRGKPRAGARITSLAVASAAALVAAGFLGAVYVNAAWDASPSAVHSVPVLGKSISRSSRSETYTLRVRSWRDGRSEEELPVKRSLYYAAATGRTLQVTTKPGWLRHEWVVSVSLEQ